MIETNDPVIADNSSHWRYEKCPRLGAKVLLLTVGDTLTEGHWRGEVGEFFKAWHPVPKRDKKRESELGLLTSEQVQPHRPRLSGE